MKEKHWRENLFLWRSANERCTKSALEFEFEIEKRMTTWNELTIYIFALQVLRILKKKNRDAENCGIGNALSTFARFPDFVEKKSKSWHCQCNKTTNKKKHGISQSIGIKWMKAEAKNKKTKRRVDKSDMNSFKCVFSALYRDS